MTTMASKGAKKVIRFCVISSWCWHELWESDPK